MTGLWRTTRQAAFENFYEEHVDKVHRFLRVRSSAETAEELTAEVFLSAFRRWDEGEHIEVGWLMTVARRRLIDEWRRTARVQGRMQKLAPLRTQQSPGLQQETEARHLILEVLDQLPLAQRQALVLRYLDDLSVASVAKTMGRSYVATESLLARARRNFEQRYIGTTKDTRAIARTGSPSHAYATAT